jgi:hypothetical protein
VEWGEINGICRRPAGTGPPLGSLSTLSPDIPLLKGRFFSEHDTSDSQWVAIIDEKLHASGQTRIPLKNMSGSILSSS